MTDETVHTFEDFKTSIVLSGASFLEMLTVVCINNEMFFKQK